MAGNKRKKTSPAQLKAEERQIQALNLRKAGIGFREIATELGYSGPSSAYVAVTSALEKARSEPAEELRTLMLARLDEMFTGVWETAIAGDVDAISAALRIEERRAKLLGLDKAPPLVGVSINKNSTVDIDFSGMSSTELRELIRQEREQNDDHEGGSGTGTTGACTA